MTFVRRSARHLLDRDGQPRQFRGVGIGNWLLVEGYMWRFFAGANRPRTIEAMLAELAGDEWAAAYWPRFRDAFFTRDDVARIAEAGFDHIRVPFNWRLFLDEQGAFLDEGFARLEQVVDWCREAGLLVLFDMHGAPGGQTGANIDDSAADRPALFESPRYRSMCIALWVEIARRYADEPVVMGYDLLNEPLRDEFQHIYRAGLVDLYRDLTAAIREVDRNHLIMYEGSHWATNFYSFDSVWDDNSCLQFHRYWTAPDRLGLHHPLEFATRLDLPLYMGEGGENSDAWLRAAFGSYDELGISWNFWPWKKLDNRSSPADAPAPEGWDAVIARAEGRGPGPDRETSRRLFDEVLEAFRLENCRWHQDLIDALFQAPRGWVPAYAVVGGMDERRFKLEGGNKVVDPWDADPAVRALAPQVVLLLAPGEQASFVASSAPAAARVVEAEGSPSSPSVSIEAVAAVPAGGARVTLTGGAQGSRVVGLELG